MNKLFGEKKQLLALSRIHLDCRVRKTSLGTERLAS